MYVSVVFVIRCPAQWVYLWLENSALYNYRNYLLLLLLTFKPNGFLCLTCALSLLFLSVTPGAITLTATPSGVTTWTFNETLTLTCNGPVGTVEGNTQVRWLLRCCTGTFFSHTRGRQYTGTLTSQVLYWDVLQSYQGKATHRYADFSGVVLGHSSVISGINRYADFSGVVLWSSSVIPGEGNTQVRWLLRCCTGTLFSHIRDTQVHWLLRCCTGTSSVMPGEGNTQVRWLLRCCTGMLCSHARGGQHTGTLTSQVLYWDVVQSCQGRATHRYADFSGVVLGCCAVILGIHSYADFRCFTVVFFSHTHKTRIVVENEIHQKVSFSGVA